MARLTRAESQARTRGILIDAALNLFLRQGFTNTPLDQISLEAGFTRGAVYSNFASKAELGLAVLDQMYAEVVSQALSAISTAPQQLGPTVGAMVRSFEESFGDPKWLRLEVEIAAACTDDQLEQSFGARYKFLRASIEAGIANVIDDQSSNDVAFLLFSALLGAGIQRAADPTVTLQRVLDAVRPIIGEA